MSSIRLLEYTYIRVAVNTVIITTMYTPFTLEYHLLRDLVYRESSQERLTRSPLYPLLVITKAQDTRRASPTNVTVSRKVITALLFRGYYDETASERKAVHLHYFYKA